MGWSMRRFPALSILSLALLGGIGSSRAEAQVTGYQFGPRISSGAGGYQPTSTLAYSPYLNLLRRGNPLYQNYYGLVRPEIDVRRSIQGLRLEAYTNQQNIASLESQAIPASGHATNFFNTSHYFYNRGG